MSILYRMKTMPRILRDMFGRRGKTYYTFCCVSNNFNFGLDFFATLWYLQMVLATENIAQTLKAFGESIVLHHYIFEKNITYSSKESSFWANVRTIT